MASDYQVKVARDIAGYDDFGVPRVRRGPARVVVVAAQREMVFGDRDAPAVTADPGFEMGAVHSSELPYFFPHYDNTSKVAGPDLKPASLVLAKQMTAYWMSFAKSGKPVAKEGPAWPLFKQDGDVMRFDPGKVGPFDAGAAHNCGFWKTLYPKLLTQ